MRVGLLDIIEAAYTLDGPPEAWMHKVGETVDGYLGHGLGLIAIRYRIGHDLRLEVLSMVPINMTAQAISAVQRATSNLPPSYVTATFASVPCDMARSTGPADVQELTHTLFHDHFEPSGWNEIMTINGLDPTRNGLVLGVGLPNRDTMTTKMRSRWSRVAAHIAAAHRLRARLGGTARVVGSADAVLTPDGRVEHAENDAKSREARTDLTDGVHALERSRGKLNRSDPDLALAERKALVAARWTLVDHFETDGKHYVLAQRNEATLRGFVTLTAREHQALGFASLGHSNKLISYEMGITPSTVSVLLHRAAKKLGASSRAAMLEAYARLLELRTNAESR
jgi:DNA-binding CsgD family transcriptional regulator